MNDISTGVGNGYSRRDFLKAAGVGIAGVAGWGAVPAEGSALASRAEACVWIHLSGGLSQLDTFDPKPEAPLDIRGPFAFRRSGIPGVQVCQHLPRIAEILGETTLIRSCSSDETNHDRAAHYWFTGCRPTVALDSTPLGSFLAAKGSRGRFSAETVIHSSPEGATTKRFFRFPASYSSAMVERNDLVEACRVALQSVEAGCRFVTVADEGWDAHENLHAQYQAKKLPELDQALSSLLIGLQRRGLWKDTLVVLMGEFGRSPKINAHGGRDHWPHSGCAILAGGPMRRGLVIGETDARGAFPLHAPMTPPALAKMILPAMGLNEECLTRSDLPA